MNIRCPQCQTVFRVNPARIPPAGVRARCARCGGAFTVNPPASGSAHEAAAPVSGDAAVRPSPAPVRPPAPAATNVPPRGQAPHPKANAPRPGAPAGGQAPAPGGGSGTGTASRPAPLFGSRDPKARAQRLARALVSDIVAYHPERRDRSLDTGNLRTEFREEIMKSWEEYVAQVGLETAKSTPYFRDALNNILAGGHQVF